MIFVGDDWAEAHHDIYICDETGGRLAALRLKAREFVRTWRRGGPTSGDQAALAELNQVLTAQMEEMNRVHAQRLDQLSRRLAVLELLADYERR